MRTVPFSWGEKKAAFWNCLVWRLATATCLRYAPKACSAGFIDECLAGQFMLIFSPIREISTRLTWCAHVISFMKIKYGPTVPLEIHTNSLYFKLLTLQWVKLCICIETYIHTYKWCLLTSVFNQHQNDSNAQYTLIEPQFFSR